ncbi:MAG: hypothetical protein KDC95_13620 [Planctomycetes bacterium]|nr:hypothetical protein [Planctomycetota bacterium]
MQPTRKRFRTLAIAGFALSFLLIACVLGGPQDWDSNLGPVVPHDTFPGDCSLCHETGSWSKIRTSFEFDHEAETGVPLIGAHKTAKCLRCHNDRGPLDRFIVLGCKGCHEDVHQGHLGARCESCHDEASTTWIPREVIREHQRTRFPLVGAHAGVACFRCHSGAEVGNYKFADVRCESCHQDALASAKAPDHIAQGWTRDCERCHRPTGWSGSHFSHSQWPLTGAHAAAMCEQCHKNGIYKGTPRNCVDCHRAEYDATTEPPHAGAGFSIQCDQCHGTSMWQGAHFDHGIWRLDGAHAGAACSKCHTGGIYKGTPRNCVDCHRPDYDSAKSPDHAAASFPLDCEQCHSTSRWEGAKFDHNTWPLDGAHSAASCNKCHINNVYQGTPRNCVDCHRNDYDATTSPDHAASNFPLDCTQCHVTSQWKGAKFDHNTWPLDGAHKTVNCTACHKNNVYKGTPRECVDCHRADYDGTTNPNHSQLNYSLVCTNCHSTTTWQGASFNHRFPITSGAHKGLSCTECHKNPTSYTEFTCTDCHEHSQTRMDDKHKGVSNYAWTSAKCYQCHPNGKH